MSKVRLEIKVKIYEESINVKILQVSKVYHRDSAA